jgi:phenylacetate-CoA ligase
LAHAIVVPSAYLVDVFHEFGLSARPVANFVEPESIPHRRREQIAPIVMSNRNFEPLYNVACALRAFALLQRRFPDARLILVGGGSQRAALQRLATELALRNVEWVGQVQPDRMGRYYDAADIYVNTPDIDNMPSSVLEAFAAGLPVVSTDAGGVPYIVDHGRTGLLAPRGDAHALASHMIQLCTDPGMVRTITTAARAEFQARYTWDAVRPHWESVYTSLVTGPRGKQNGAPGSGTRMTGSR